MQYQVVVPINPRKRNPSLNDYLKAERQTFRTKTGKFMTKGAVMKKEWQQYISIYIRKDLKRLRIESPVIIHYHYYDFDQRRDLGNIHAPWQKFFEDAMQSCGVLENDNQKYVVGFTADFHIDKLNPRIVIEIEEV